MFVSKKCVILQIVNSNVIKQKSSITQKHSKK